ncbi:MAG TPA: aldolase [Anaerolineae bacterium]|nr:aldolase [Anaerolineae bacterium]
MKGHRWHHIFRPDGRTVILALDHAGMFGMAAGLDAPGEVIRQARRGGADAILTTYGTAARFADEIGDLGLILRMDGGVSSLAQERRPLRLLYSVADALRLGADGVACMGWPGSRFEGETLPYLARLAARCAAWNVPLLAEMLPGGFESPGEQWTPENIGHACRIGAEMGADFIKTAYTGDRESFRRIVERVPVPLVVLGGGAATDTRAFLTAIHDALAAGAAGVAVGRNIYRHPSPERMTAAIVALVHGGATVAEAYLEVEGR